jgi:hypothetical protein
VGLDCPLDAFEQLVFDHHDDADVSGIVRVIDWQPVHWEKSICQASRRAVSAFPGRIAMRSTKRMPGR